MSEIPTILTFSSVFLASLLGSPHCAGMCGGFVALYSHHSTCQVSSHLSYSLGRLATYLVLGLFASILGNSFDQTLVSLGIHNASALIIGALLVIMGCVQLLTLCSSISFLLKMLRSLAGNTSGWLAKHLDLRKIVKRPFLIGVGTTLLPCGWLYTFVALCFSLSNIEALLVMCAFWLGTLPILLSVGTLGRALTQRLGIRLPIVTSILIIIAGLASLKTHLSGHTHTQHHHLETKDQVTSNTPI